MSKISQFCFLTTIISTFALLTNANAVSEIEMVNLSANDESDDLLLQKIVNLMQSKSNANIRYLNIMKI